MSEENEHDHEHHGPFAFFLGPTPEQREHARMIAESNGHEMRNFFYGLTEDQCVILMNVISNILATEGSAGSYYQGLITMVLDTKHKKCMGCGKDHDKALAEMADPTVSSQGTVADHEAAIVTEAVEKAALPTFPAKGTEAYDRLMILYGMEQDDEGTDNVMCKNCGKWYPNLQDRTLRNSDKSGCSGCVHKEKFG